MNSQSILSQAAGIVASAIAAPMLVTTDPSEKRKPN